MARRVITLMGEDLVTVTEDGQASEAITPGYMVMGFGTIAKQTIDALKAPMRVALEREEMGNDIDVDYAIGDTVKVGHFPPGSRFYGWLVSGETIAAGDLLEATGAGNFEALAGAEPLTMAVEAVTSVAPGDTRIRLEVI